MWAMMQKFLITAWSVWAGAGRDGCAFGLTGLGELEELAGLAGLAWLTGLAGSAGLAGLVCDTHVRFGYSPPRGLGVP